jgi:sigma-B regulation protein RsbU (phosphoserine phosphatase)
MTIFILDGSCHNGRQGTMAAKTKKNIEVPHADVMQDTKTEKVMGCIEPLPEKGHTIAKIASSYYFVRHDVKIRTLSDELARDQNIFAVGVVDDDDRVLGVIIRRDLFDILGKQFGRDLYINKKVSAVMKDVPHFDLKSNIFGVAEELSDVLYSFHLSYYVLSDGEMRFQGIFSTRDLLVFMSQMTQKDIDLARRLQRSIVRDEVFEEGERIKIAAASVMAKGVGGDYYMVDNYDRESNWLIAVCDVSGKGIAASLISAIIGGMLRIYDFNNGLKGFIVRLNEYIHITFETERFITGIFVHFNEETGELSLYDLGHSYIFIYRDGKMLKMTTRDDNIPLGVRQHMLPRAARFTMEKNDILTILTDGMIEQNNPDGREYGIRRLSGVIEKFKDKGVRRVRDEVLADIQVFRKNQPQHDDMTLVIMEYTGG